MKPRSSVISVTAVLGVLCIANGIDVRAEAAVPTDPYTLQGQEKMASLRADDPPTRSRAAEALGYMRHYPAEAALVDALRDDHAPTRRNAALALGWCGGRRTLMPLVERLDDADWTVRQSASVALTNTTATCAPDWPRCTRTGSIFR